MQTATTEANRRRDECRVDVKINRPTHLINWEEVAATNRELIDDIEDSVVNYLRNIRRYPATPTIIAEGITKAGYKYPYDFLNGRGLAGVIRHLADRHYFERIRRLQVGPRMTDYLWAGTECHHDTWLVARDKMLTGKRVKLGLERLAH